jgi:hypothetical protein
MFRRLGAGVVIASLLGSSVACSANDPRGGDTIDAKRQTVSTPGTGNPTHGLVVPLATLTARTDRTRR